MNLFTSLHLLILSHLLPVISTARILVFLPTSAKSHTNCFVPLIEELNRRNHEIIMVTMYPPTPPIPGVKIVFLENTLRKKDELAPAAWQRSSFWSISNVWKMKQFATDLCDTSFADPGLIEFLNHPGLFDVVLISSVYYECTTAMVGSLKAPIVMVSPSTLLTDIAWQLDIPQPWSYVPFLMLPYSSEMTFTQRFINTLVSTVLILVRKGLVHPINDAVDQSRFPNAPSIGEVVKNVSFILVNSHFSVDGPRPSMPHLAEVGAMHCRPASTLPKVRFSSVS